jgi:aspartyl protease family protein
LVFRFAANLLQTAMRNLLFASVAIVILGVTAPGLLTRYVNPDGGVAEAARHEDAAEEPEAGGGGGQVSIRAARDGHFYVDGEINFRDVDFVVDTGASAVVLRESDALAAGIRVSKAQFDKPVSTANGVTHAAAVMIDALTVEDIRVTGVRALVLPDEALSISLLGASFLNRLGRFEVADGTLIFEN